MALSQGRNQALKCSSSHNPKSSHPEVSVQILEERLFISHLLVRDSSGGQVGGSVPGFCSQAGQPNVWQHGLCIPYRASMIWFHWFSLIFTIRLEFSDCVMLRSKSFFFCSSGLSTFGAFGCFAFLFFCCSDVWPLNSTSKLEATPEVDIFVVMTSLMACLCALLSLMSAWPCTPLPTEHWSDRLSSIRSKTL